MFHKGPTASRYRHQAFLRIQILQRAVPAYCNAQEQCSVRSGSLQSCVLCLFLTFDSHWADYMILNGMPVIPSFSSVSP